MIQSLLFSRVPQPYQYSALSQYDNDPDEEINDLDDHLEMLVQDSSSEDLEEEEANQNDQKEIKADANEVKVKLFQKLKICVCRKKSNHLGLNIQNNIVRIFKFGHFIQLYLISSMQQNKIFIETGYFIFLLHFNLLNLNI